MKYKTEIIAEILEKRGHKKSSLHYQSECIEPWIEETKGAYPKLCDYESEWLNYINENPIGEFPYETVTNVTEATVNNVVPYAYKSAILKGQTLVNLINLQNFASLDNLLFTYDLPVTNNTTYTVIAVLRGSDKIRTNTENVFRIKSNDANGDELINVQQITPNDISTIINLCQTIKITTQNNLHIRLYNTLPENLKIIILEGDHTQEDIPYFEGMQSVKMPVLTTSNEDGTKTNILTVNEGVELRGIGDVQDELDLLTGEMTERIGEIVLDGSQNLSITQTGENTIRYQYVFNDKSYGFTNVVSDILPTINVFGSDMECISGSNNNSNILFRLSKEKATNVQECKQYLQQNPITIHYERITPTIKTVDLTIVNQDGDTLSKLTPIEGTMHLRTDGTPLKPTISMEVPVEAITQNLMSFIVEE